MICILVCCIVLEVACKRTRYSPNLFRIRKISLSICSRSVWNSSISSAFLAPKPVEHKVFGEVAV